MEFTLLMFILLATVLLVGILYLLSFKNLKKNLHGRDESYYMGVGMSMGFSLMMPFALLFGIAIDNIVLGIVFGPSLGAAMGVSIGQSLKKKYGDDRPMTETEARIQRLGLVAGLLILLAGVAVALALFFE